MRYSVKKNIFVVALINARSLKDKLNSLQDNLTEMGADLCLLTETWFKECSQINMILEDFTNRTDFGFIRRDRTGLKRGGGVAICYDKNKISFVRSKLPPSKHEVLAAVGRRTGQRRKIVCIVVYVPPWYNADQNRSLYSYINDVILAIKNKYESPYILIGGDFNKRSVSEATRDFPEIKQIVTGATRGDNVLDIMTCNFSGSLVDCGTSNPIEDQFGIGSDHLTVYALDLTT